MDVIANFGCKSSEFLALLWYLDAAEIRVVQKDKEHLSSPTEQRDLVQKRIPEALDGRSVHFIVEDMSKLKEEQLRSNSCDLAYCEDVLYDIHLESGDLARVQSAVNEMTRVVKPEGWVVAVESMIGAQVEEVTDEFLSQRLGRKVTRQVPTSNPIDISPLFEALDRQDLCNAPDWSYCYRKRKD